jgi:hypothetical protein
MLKALSSEMDPAEIRIIQKARTAVGNSRNSSRRNVIVLAAIGLKAFIAQFPTGWSIHCAVSYRKKQHSGY